MKAFLFLTLALSEHMMEDFCEVAGKEKNNLFEQKLVVEGSRHLGRCE